jgi:hypothetical protein
MTSSGLQDQSGDEANPDYWRSQAEHWHQKADELEEEIKAITAPEIIRFRGTEGDVMWERDLYKMPTRCWAKAAQAEPYIEDWHRVESGGMLLALSPSSCVTCLIVEQEILGDA